MSPTTISTGSQFHEYRTINVASIFAHLRGTNILFHDPRQNCQPPSSHVIQLTRTIFELNSCIKETNVLSNFHENWAKNVTSTNEKCPAHWRPCFFTDPDYFQTAKIVTSTVFTREKCPAHWRPCFFAELDHFQIVTSSVFTRKTAPPTGGHVFQRIGTTFELNQDIIKTNILTNFEHGRDFIGTKLLTKFHKDGTRNVASRVFTSKC
ncbi:hypothetical protein DPMN_071771 [Dreissena polymorpha]|uniref:Uncharacterized protein n=1 Tax=Dreissena polymorpha TaxID=45954 RepID=A0A9D3Z853_DREPO|nr:hypothetical protein DPMN_071771 [Dreissena polymorpha]